MRLDQFIDKLRHRSLKILIVSSDNVELYDGTVGTYLTSVFRQNNAKRRIALIHPMYDNLIIELVVRSDQLCEI